MQGSSVAKDIHGQADVHLYGACRVGNVHAAGDVHITGQPRTATLQPQGRVVTH